jgi:predicted transcriptional regulator
MFRASQRKPLSALERTVMQQVWDSGAATAEDVRLALVEAHPMKESTARTVLRRLEEKGYLRHKVVGRTYHYRPVDPKESVAAQAVRQILDRFCDGSVEQLLVGMVDHEVVEPEELEQLAARIAAARRNDKEKP